MKTKLNQQQSQTTNLYDQDFNLWLEKTANLLKNRQLEELDYDNLIEEIEAMGRSEKRAIESNLVVLLMHLLKYKYQPKKRTNSWRYTIREHRRRIILSLEDSPSLKRYLADVFNSCYIYARQEAVDETGLSLGVFPLESPFSVEQTLNFEFLPQ
ncbi:MAG TPA: DUF29 domain-containing protein [Cyanothece sp. UBA12306]|nr:DUF29 domain-containing protein [Cyanothece sp. UBA12306]